MPDTPKNPYVSNWNSEGDALEDSGLSAVTNKGTFQYPEAVNMRRCPSISGHQISMIPFRLASRTKYTSVPRRNAIKTQYGD